MNLDASLPPQRLYLAVGEDVNQARPLFTGDIFREVEIPGVGVAPAILIAHPCSIRGRAGSLKERMPMALVETHHAVSDEKWASGYFDRFPLPGLPLDGDFHVVRFGSFGLARADSLDETDRLACLSEPGINLLQQRQVFHLTRLAVPATRFQEAFDHTYEEAELLENWATDLAEVDADPAKSFECWIQEGTPTRQRRLLDPAERAPIRRELMREIDSQMERP